MSQMELGRVPQRLGRHQTLTGAIAPSCPLCQLQWRCATRTAAESDRRAALHYNANMLGAALKVWVLLRCCQQCSHLLDPEDHRRIP